MLIERTKGKTKGGRNGRGKKKKVNEPRSFKQGADGSSNVGGMKFMKMQQSA